MTALRNVRLHFLPVCLSIVVLGLHCLRDSSKRFLFFLLPLPLSSSSPLDDAVIKGLSRSLAGALKSPANDKVFVLIARGTTEDTERERFLLSFVAFGGQLRDARLVGAQKEARAKKVL